MRTQIKMGINSIYVHLISKLQKKYLKTFVMGLATMLTVIQPTIVAAQVDILGTGAPCDFPDLSSAIAAASPGDTLLVEEGTTLFENIGVINIDLTIRAGIPGCAGVSNPASPNAIIDGNHLDRVATISASVTLRQISILNGETNLGGSGLLVTAAGDLTLLDSTVSFNETNGLLVNFDPLGTGIHLETGGNLLLQGNSTVMGNINYHLGAGGIYIADGATAVIEDDAEIGTPLFGINETQFCCGGGIMVEGDLELRGNARVRGNIGGGAGGGIYINGGTVEIFDQVLISDNIASDGGGISVHGNGSLVALGAEGSIIIENNESTSEGGGIEQDGGSINLTEVTLQSNTAGNCGGGIESHSDSGTPDVVLTYVTITDNTADECGGGIALTDGNLEMDRVQISDNTAVTDGGGVFLSGPEVDANMEESTIKFNYSEARGGGIALLDDAFLVLDTSNLKHNQSDSDGGAIFISGINSELHAFNGQVRNNEAVRGAGLFIDSGIVNLSEEDFGFNAAETEGGAIRQRGNSTLSFIDGRARLNTAGTMGGAFAVSGGSAQLEGLNVMGNSAGTDGGALTVASNGVVSTIDVWFRNNNAGSRGGAIALLSSGPNTNPQLTVTGAIVPEEACPSRPALAPNEYCSELRNNFAVDGGGAIFMEDGVSTLVRTAIMENDSTAQGSAIGMMDHPTGIPEMTAHNILMVQNGSNPAIDVVRVQNSTLVAEHLTSADNVGVPFRFAAGSSGSNLRRSIVWDNSLVEIDPALSIGASCTMFRNVPIGGATTGIRQDFGLDPFFVTDPIRGDYRLDSVISINAVNQCLLGLAVDLDGFSRNSLFDRGAFEAF